MKFKAMLLGLSVITALPAFAQKPVYLDTGKPIEERVKDALNRMTLEEKVKMIHAQSKFSSAGVPRLGIPEVWATDGPHGIRPEVLWDEWDQGWMDKRFLYCLSGIDVSFCYMESRNVASLWEKYR